MKAPRKESATARDNRAKSMIESAIKENKYSATIRNNSARRILEIAIKENKDPVIADLLEVIRLKLK